MENADSCVLHETQTVICITFDVRCSLRSYCCSGEGRGRKKRLLWDKKGWRAPGAPPPGSATETFRRTTQIYQEALNKSELNYQLKYKNYEPKPNRKRTRKITWFNPPWSMQVRSNIAKQFLEAIDNCFPQGHKLRPIFNRNTVKVSYSCLPNVKATIDAHNKKHLKQKEQNNVTTDNPTAADKQPNMGNQTVVGNQTTVDNHTAANNQTEVNSQITANNETTPDNQTATNKKENKTCNCKNPKLCPLDGNCKQKSVIYQAKVTVKKTGRGKEEIETYVGSTGGDFKIRLANHKHTFKNEALKNSTTLSQHIWKLNKAKKEYTITWKILDKAEVYTNKAKKCKLCNLEKFYIMYKKGQSTLNTKRGLINMCRHKKSFLLSNWKKPPDRTT